MNLKSKFLFWSTALLGLTLCFGSVSIWTLVHLWNAAKLTAVEYDAMDRADAATAQVAWLRDVLRGNDSQTYREIRFFAPIQTEVTEIQRELLLASRLDDGDGAAEAELGKSVAGHLDDVVKQSVGQSGHITADGVQSVAEAAAALEQLRQSLSEISKLIPGAARHHVIAAADQLFHRLEWSCFILLIVLIISIAIHFAQYRALVRPLLWLRDNMQRSAGDHYRWEIPGRGDQEFRDVAKCFNGLVRDLADLYRNLEQKVIARSRELVRSERLASVGFLAAGVAHEINNPLSVIAGYAELARKSLRKIMLGTGSENIAGPEAEVEAAQLISAVEAQDIIHDEAFRCKEITGRLLSLARGGGEGRETLCMGELARQVTVLTKGLKNYADRRVVLEFDQAEPLEVIANPSEMKQVILNLTVNALEAVPPQRGEVRIGGRRAGEWVELSVEDNGKGMGQETLEHVFEPFFTAKRGAGEPGTGLGLSITHAIIESHGGRIAAESDGPGRGSRFTVWLPAQLKLSGEFGKGAAVHA
jgi:two-component system, NtrC family, sensor kinase